MPYRIEHGVLGLQGQHTWFGGPDPVVLNALPYRLSEIPGLHDLPDSEDPREAAIARIGEHDYPTEPLGKTVIYKGTLEGNDPLEMLLAARVLRSAFSDRRQTHLMAVAPNIADPYADVDSPTWSYRAKCLAVSVPDTWAKLKFSREFQITLRMSDPRFYVAALSVDVTGNAILVTNVGDAPVDPVLTIAGAFGDITVSRAGGSRILTFRTGGSSGSLIIDFAARTATIDSDPVELVVPDSTWWDRGVDGIPPGGSVISQSGGTSVRVQFAPASW